MKDHTKDEFGAIYVAIGRAHFLMAISSILSLNRSNPYMPVCLVTDQQKDERFKDVKIDFWKFVDFKKDQNRLVKLNIYKYSPFKKTIFIDSDTLVLGNLSIGGFYLDYFDIAIKQKTKPYPDSPKAREKIFNGTRSIADLPHWNSGLILFRKNTKVENFFGLWINSFKTNNSQFDQVSLVGSEPRLHPAHVA